MIRYDIEKGKVLRYSREELFRQYLKERSYISKVVYETGELMCLLKGSYFSFKEVYKATIGECRKFDGFCRAFIYQGMSEIEVCEDRGAQALYTVYKDDLGAIYVSDRKNGTWIREEDLDKVNFVGQALESLETTQKFIFRARVKHWFMESLMNCMIIGVNKCLIS